MKGGRHGRFGTGLAGRIGACSVASLALMAPAALAQTTESPQIEAITVTAQHRLEYAKDIPIAVSSLSASAVEDITAGGDDIRALAARTPSLNIDSTLGRTFPHFYIRGLGNADYTFEMQQPVSVVRDDVAVENTTLKGFPAFDIADVEVLRGPQGSLFGRNTPAGVVKIDSVKPGDETSGYADLSYGTYNSVDFNGAIGGAIIKHLLDFRVSVLEERRDDWVTNINPDYRYPQHQQLEGYSDFAARAQLLYTPTSDLNALFETDLRSLDGSTRLYRANIILKGSNDLVPGFNADQVDINGDNYQNEGSWGAHLTVNDAVGPVTLTSISAYEHGSIRERIDVSGGNFTAPPPIGSAPPGFPNASSGTIPGLDQVSEELRFATNGNGRFFNQGGLYYFHEYLKVVDDLYKPTGAVNVIQTITQSTESYAAFDSASYKLTSDLTAGAGVRVTHDAKALAASCQAVCAAPTPSQLSTGDTQPTFDVSATYAVTQDTNVYARIATGYLAPAIDGRNILSDFGNAAAGALSEAKAETTTSYEVGVKSALWDHRASLNLTGYYWKTDDLQLAAVGGTANAVQLVNAQSAIGEGLETSFEVKPIENLLLDLEASYNFTQIQDPALEIHGCGGGCTMENPRDPRTGNYRIDGNPLPSAPRWIASASGRYSVPLQNDTEVYLVNSWTYRSSEDFFLYKSAEFTGQPLLLGDLRIAYADHDGGWEVAGYIHNLLDEVKVTGAVDFDNLTGMVNDPRTGGVELRVKF